MNALALASSAYIRLTTSTTLQPPPAAGGEAAIWCKRSSMMASVSASPEAPAAIAIVS
eukprot:CAMPEP_0173393672 /NCGR_PEP_ID=MMETSP1356-20130122/22246_1 /TAXON_ID=77927 ORGANISM="Hemiselmis virescens, Strain PCC157" /NCGR_SAMPLE_ID=MMETSP1356 /ASSEMBLY_ACC=CAM_ASM_000847 /LENGTH=57 /DNA_ID=CAMNT_0014351729 /DNA_START=101 /DNA_END=271 /DNA_ORIENTATION=-